MPFQSYEHLLQSTSNGNTFRFDYTFLMPFTPIQNRWYDTSAMLQKNTNQNLFSGTARTWTTCTGSAGNGTEVFGMPSGPSVSPATKHLVTVGANPNFTGATITLVDIQGYWNRINTNSTVSQALSGTPSLRYANGEGCRMYLVSTTAVGVGNPGLTVSYTNQAGVTGRSLDGTVFLANSGPLASHILHSNVSSNTIVVSPSGIAPFLPLQAGDWGVQNVSSVQLTGTAYTGSGLAALVIARPIITFYSVQSTIYQDKDYFTTIPSLPRIRDNACLVWLVNPYGAAPASTGMINGHIDYAWA